MKKTKAVFIIVLTIILTIICGGYSNGHSVELDPKSLISFPWFVMGGSGSISISSTVSNYTLYYQSVEIPNDVYSQIKKNETDGENDLKTLKEAYTKLENEVNNLKATYNEANEAYQTAKKNTDVSATELETLKVAYETAATNYNNKAQEYNAKIKEYNEKVKEIQNKIKELTPTYVEKDWIKTTDGKFQVDLTQFSGEQAFVIWAKLTTSDGNTYYDESIFTMEGTKKAEVKATGVSLDKTTLSITNGSDYTLTATLTPSDATDKSIKWTSDNEDVATVSNGKITAKSVGSATITATTNDGNYTSTCKVTVTEKTVINDIEKKEEITPKVDNEPKSKISNDGTVAKTGTLPYTGVYSIAFILIIGISIAGIVFYKRYKFLNIK